MKNTLLMRKTEAGRGFNISPAPALAANQISVFPLAETEMLTLTLGCNLQIDL